MCNYLAEGWAWHAHVMLVAMTWLHVIGWNAAGWLHQCCKQQATAIIACCVLFLSLQLTNTATLTPSGGQATSKTAGATFSVTGCSVLPTVSLSNIQTFAAVTWAWSMTKTANPTQVQIPVGGAGSTQYNVQLTRTRSTGNYAMSGTLTIINPATFPMYISSVTLMSTSGSFGALPPACLGGSNVGGSTISGVTGPGWGRRRRLLGLPAVRKLLQWATGTQFGPTTVANPYAFAPTTSATGSFLIAAGAQIECLFNVTAGELSAWQMLCVVSHLRPLAVG